MLAPTDSFSSTSPSTAILAFVTKLSPCNLPFLTLASRVTFVWYDDANTIHLQWKWEEVLCYDSTANGRDATIWNFSFSLLSKPKDQFDSEMRLLKFPARTSTPKAKPRWVFSIYDLLRSDYPQKKKLSSTLNRPNIKQ